MQIGRIVFRVHAIKRMFERQIGVDDVIHVLNSGQIIEAYADDLPHPSCLMLGWCGERPLHVVAARNEDDGETIVVTVYEPDGNLWESNFTRRKS